ncbi:MAG: GNAT family N-acetyltransferase [Tissierella sp.]|uniref:GNAT family N-acetyltransferase n=1 Tax=Tissierella sp. TaxID=41274 RepID=UPI003F9BB8B8
MNKKDYMKIAHKNLRDVLKFRSESVKNGKVYETEDFLLFSIGTKTSDGHLNGCVPFNTKAYKETFEAAEKFFGQLGFDYSVWIRDGIDTDLENLLLEKDFILQRKPGSTIMKKEERIKDAPFPQGYTLKEVETQEDLDGFAKVVAEAFKKDEHVIDAMFSSQKPYKSDHSKTFIISDPEGRVVSGSITSISEDSAGLYFVGTLESQRGKGLGKAVVKASTNFAFDLGKDIAILQASKHGKIIYDKLGYDQIGMYKPYSRTNTKQNTEG